MLAFCALRVLRFNTASGKEERSIQLTPDTTMSTLCFNTASGKEERSITLSMIVQHIFLKAFQYRKR